MCRRDFCHLELFLDNIYNLPRLECSSITIMLKLMLLMQIMATAYIRHEPWEMGVHKRNGVVYLDVHKLPERPQSELERRRY